MPGARLVDYTDAEFLNICNDVASADGWFETYEVADKLGLVNNNGASIKHGTQAVGSRCSWMKFYGFIRQDTKKKNRWRITDKGLRYMVGRIPEAQRKALEKLTKEAGADLMSLIGEEFFLPGDRMLQAGLRRTFQYYAYKGKRVRPRASK